ncbi:MAG: DUF2232 domain-containing protein [Halofilum sp. (in: g-proteobacteria)]|nr:DUF2232 domain-containing protein [Halofilum sp. (in: g-proteobacteria)]
MKGFAAFVMRGPVQAASVAAAGLMLGYVLPPFAWLSAAVVALVTLRLGDAALARMALPGVAVVALAGLAAFGRPGAVLVGALAAWLPAIVLARVLRQRARLDDTLLVACGLGWLVVAGIHLWLPDPAAAWRELLAALIQPQRMAAELQVSPEALEQLITRSAPLMTGMLGASVVLSAVTSVLLARWWQALLDNPGGFQREFHALRLGRVAAATTAVLGAAAALTSSMLVAGLALVALTVYVLQGLAVVHGVVRRRGMHVAWVAGIYVLGVMLPLQVMVGLVLVGIADAWADFRGQAAAPD